MITYEKARHYLWSLFGAIGIVIFWEGVWGGIGGLPYLSIWWVSFIVGIAMLSFSGIIFKQYDPLEEVERSAHEVMHRINRHPQKHEFRITYHDKMKGHHTLEAKDLQRIEKGFLVFLQKGKEVFVPIHRVTEVLHKNKSYWKV